MTNDKCHGSCTQPKMLVELEIYKKALELACEDIGNAMSCRNCWVSMKTECETGTECLCKNGSFLLNTYLQKAKGILNEQ